VNWKLVIIAVALIGGSLLAGYIVYKVFEEYLFKPTKLPSIDALVRTEHTSNGTKLVLIIRSVQNVPITWEEIKIFVKTNTTSWSEVKPTHTGIVLGGQEVALGYFTPGETVKIKIVYSDTVIWSKDVKL